MAPFCRKRCRYNKTDRSDVGLMPHSFHNWEQQRFDELFETRFSLKFAKRLEVFMFHYPKMQGGYGRR